MTAHHGRDGGSPRTGVGPAVDVGEVQTRRGTVPAQSGGQSGGPVPAAEQAGLPALSEVDFVKVFDDLPAPLLLLTPDLRIVHANKARLRATGTTLAEQVGRPLFEVFPPNPAEPGSDAMATLRDALQLAVRTGEPQTMAIQKYDIPRPDGTYEERYWSPRNIPVKDESGRVALVVHRSDDITDYVRERDALRRQEVQGASLRQRITEVESDLLSRTREFEQLNARLRRTSDAERRTARALAALANTISAFAATQSREELFEQLTRACRGILAAEGVAAALRTSDTELAVWSTEVDGVQVLSLESEDPLAHAARGQRVFVPAPVGTDPDEASGPEDDGPALAALPLRSGRRTLGSFLVSWSAIRPLSTRDVRLVEAIGVQFAHAVARVSLLEDERRQASATRTLAETLQRYLLTEPPQTDHLQVAVHYQPAAQEAQVGGDWYDAFLAPDGSTTLVVGDVAGHDRNAAATMAQLRNVLRGVAQALGASPARVLTTLDRAMSALGVEALATAVLCQVKPHPTTGDHRVLQWANAGHPPPLLLDPDGSTRFLESAPGLMLGVDPDSEREDDEVVLLPGTTVVLYSDGLVERRGESLDDGLQRLREAAEEYAGLGPHQLSDALRTRMAPDSEDDIAMVTVRVAEGL
ncbi:MAG: probable regulatory protein [uncultured Nocardioidaceae bacterium]|uniref:Probable regulatory protein n=1 Tax=uncultured Nocardioidaceae bacterium TaxID=253824 RepID=A0A6J4KZA8_9ACTN|nr:MAG: probable regulatory protein [uncultured Nocardioidaceae bacterium]